MYVEAAETKRYVTIVGSRETPPEVAEILKMVGTLHGNHGYFVRSGHSGVADLAGEEGVALSKNPTNMELYLPWRSFGSQHNDSSCYIVANKLDNHAEATALAKSVIPHWDKLTNGGRLLHSRNPYQVLGIDLNTPSSALYCYAKKLKNGQVKGGTNTAVQVALKYNVPVINLYDEVLLRMYKELFLYKNAL